MCVLQRCEFEQQKASLLKQQFLSTSPVMKTSRSNRRESTALSDLRMHNTHARIFIPDSSDSFHLLDLLLIHFFTI